MNKNLGLLDVKQKTTVGGQLKNGNPNCDTIANASPFITQKSEKPETTVRIPISTTPEDTVGDHMTSTFKRKKHSVGGHFPSGYQDTEKDDVGYFHDMKTRRCGLRKPIFVAVSIVVLFFLLISMTMLLSSLMHLTDDEDNGGGDYKGGLFIRKSKSVFGPGPGDKDKKPLHDIKPPPRPPERAKSLKNSQPGKIDGSSDEQKDTKIKPYSSNTSNDENNKKDTFKEKIKKTMGDKKGSYETDGSSSSMLKYGSGDKIPDKQSEPIKTEPLGLSFHGVGEEMLEPLFVSYYLKKAKTTVINEKKKEDEEEEEEEEDIITEDETVEYAMTSNGGLIVEYDAYKYLGLDLESGKSALIDQRCCCQTDLMNVCDASTSFSDQSGYVFSCGIIRDAAEYEESDRNSMHRGDMYPVEWKLLLYLNEKMALSRRLECYFYGHIVDVFSDPKWQNNKNLDVSKRKTKNVPSSPPSYDPNASDSKKVNLKKSSGIPSSSSSSFSHPKKRVIGKPVDDVFTKKFQNDPTKEKDQYIVHYVNEGFAEAVHKSKKVFLIFLYEWTNFFSETLLAIFLKVETES